MKIVLPLVLAIILCGQTCHAFCEAEEQAYGDAIGAFPLHPATVGELSDAQSAVYAARMKFDACLKQGFKEQDRPANAPAPALGTGQTDSNFSWSDFWKEQRKEQAEKEAKAKETAHPH